MDAQQQTRAAEITERLRASMSPGKALPLDERTALQNELAGIYAADAAPRPAVDADRAALAARADMLTHALHSHRWSASDQKLIAGALFDTLQKLPDGSYTPAAISQAADPVTLPIGVLPIGLSDGAGADLDAALSGLGAAAGPADAGGGAGQ
jgi:hypothetical protein